jgi:hypothetical protein
MQQMGVKVCSRSASLFGMRFASFQSFQKFLRLVSAVPLILFFPACLANAQATPSQATATPEVPDWALPASATHKQYPSPADFHRPSKNFDTPIGHSKMWW